MGMPMMRERFRDRTEAGRQLAAELQHRHQDKPIILALPRGGVPVGYEIAKALDAPLDVLIVRKLGAPGNPELGLGAIVDGDQPHVILNDDIMRAVAPSTDYLKREEEAQLVEIERRRQLYCGTRKPPGVKDRTVILVDDGIATGGTARAALRALHASGAAAIILAVPVGPRATLAQLRNAAHEIVCLYTPNDFSAVGIYYEIFDQTSDEEVVDLLERANPGPA